jgi:catechol 2,3-dioxygenase-like lactoylglutathione lyase family enzyme
MQVEHVDFVSVLTQDLQRAKQFYVETLGLEVETEGDSDLELSCGQVTLDVFDPSSIGQPFAPSPAGIALRVPDVEAARAELERRASSSTATRSRPVSASRPGSRIPTATR